MNPADTAALATYEAAFAVREAASSAYEDAGRIKASALTVYEKSHDTYRIALATYRTAAIAFEDPDAEAVAWAEARVAYARAAR